jgi:hypothetical protein
MSPTTAGIREPILPGLSEPEDIGSRMPAVVGGIRGRGRSVPIAFCFIIVID